jgi:hypothetical protein
MALLVNLFRTVVWPHEGQQRCDGCARPVSFAIDILFIDVLALDPLAATGGSISMHYRLTANVSCGQPCRL